MSSNGKSDKIEHITFYVVISRRERRNRNFHLMVIELQLS
jgi:hypothetical protein